MSIRGKQRNVKKRNNALSPCISSHQGIANTPYHRYPLPTPNSPTSIDTSDPTVAPRYAHTGCKRTKALLKPIVVARHAPRIRYLRSSNSQQSSRSLGRRRHVLSAPGHSAQVGFLHHGGKCRHWPCGVVLMRVLGLTAAVLVKIRVERVIVIRVVDGGIGGDIGVVIIEVGVGGGGVGDEFRVGVFVVVGAGVGVCGIGGVGVAASKSWRC